MAVQTAQTYERAIFLTAVSAKDAVSESRPAERFLRTTAEGILKNCILVYHEHADEKFRHNKQCFINMVLENLFRGQILGFLLSEIQIWRITPRSSSCSVFFYSKD